MNDLIEVFIQNITDLGIRSEEQIWELEEWFALLIIPKEFKFLGFVRFEITIFFASLDVELLSKIKLLSIREFLDIGSIFIQAFR